MGREAWKPGGRVNPFKAFNSHRNPRKVLKTTGGGGNISSIMQHLKGRQGGRERKEIMIVLKKGAGEKKKTISGNGL